MAKSLRYMPLLLVLFCTLPVPASEKPIYKLTIDAPVEAAYDSLYAALENERFFVVFEANILKNISRFAERWGADFNKSKLTALRSMVFCNGWYANKVSGEDPEMTALCPLSVTLIEKDGRTTLLFVKPALLAKGSTAEGTLREVQQTIIAVFEKTATLFEGK